MTTPPVLLTVIDTEEEFDWSAPFSRQSTSVSGLAEAEVGQRLFDEFSIRPVYVIDYPVASQKEGYLPLKAFADDNRALIGAHLHPWVSPPHQEEVNRLNSFAGNLAAGLEAQKLQILTAKITEVFNHSPKIFKAGRYGLSVVTASILEDLGYEVDLSPAPPFDFSCEGGPDYSSYDNHPFLFGKTRSLLSLPTTGAYVGRLGSFAATSHAIYNLITSPELKNLHLPGIFSRLGLLERVRLSPEGYSLDELKSLTRYLRKSEVAVFSFSFHSPTLKPGCTPYVTSLNDREKFLDLCRRYFDFFLNELGGVSMTPLEIKQYYAQEQAATLKQLPLLR